MEKKPFLTEAMAQEIIQDVPTPFHVYDEKGIRENARRINKAFSWNKGFKEYFAVKALPNPVILQILQEEGCGVDCSSLTELMLSEVCGFTGSGGGILMLTVFTLVLGYNLKVAVGTSTMIMSLVALTGAVSHVSLGAQLFPLPMAIVVVSCLLGAVVSAKFANRCEIRRLNRIVGAVLILLGAVTILIKLL